MSNSHAYALSGSSLVSFDLADPTAGAIISISGVTPTDTLVGIDFRPLNGLLYGLGVDPTGDTATLYVISTETGQARVVGIAGALGLPDAANYGFDFNPAVDRIRVTTDGAALGLNFRLNPNTGALAGSDSAILGPTVSGVAYTNNQPQNGGITTLYTLDSTADVLNIQNPPNAGVQNLVGPTGVDFSVVGGFDIVAGVNAAASGSPVASGSGMALLNVGGTVGLYSIDLVTGAATFVGNFLNGITPVNGFAIQNDLGGIPAIALSADGLSLVYFNTATPGFRTSVAVGGLTAGETLVGIDFRPVNGQLFALGVNAAADTATLYRVDPSGGGVIAIGAPGGIVVGDLPDGGYGMDFSPPADRIRVTTDSGLNFRLNPSTGAVAADAPINGLPAGSTGVSAAAYTNSSIGATVTTLYTLDSVSNSLFIQNPANGGTQTSQLAVALGGSALDFTSVNGFDIPAGVRAATAGAPATGFGFADLTVGGITSLYKINLATGEAINLGMIGSAPAPLAGLTLADSLAVPVITSNGGGATGDVTVAENTTAVTTVVAIDDFGTPFVYSIAGGADAGKFQIDPATGVLTFVTAPNFEAPTDADTNNSYIVQVRASDGIQSDDQVITVNVVDGPSPVPPHWMASVGLAAHPAGLSLAGVGDLNGDGTSDYVWYNATTGNVDLWKIANGQWAGSVDVGSHPFGWQPAGVGDLNADGTADLLWHNPTTGNVDLWKISNGQWAGSVDIGPHPLGYQVAGIADFNHDGTNDVLWYNPTNGATEIWKIVNGQWSATFDVGSHPLGWVPAGTGDFNHDGTSDIAWYNPTTGNVDIWQIVNGQWNASFNVGSHPLGWTPAGIGEFNDDGTSDIVWHNAVTGNVDIWQIVNAQWAGSVSLGSHPPGSVPAGIGDFNHDFTSDIVWREVSTGLIDEWLVSNV